ncbi:hypothetical protein Tco_0726511 [Tanacetum coccineum]|uniref:Uncharacterized protein n=1 Tax=Tanacetum coccineum TaxID=301880 RepID=A0ABQ4YI43_9ASTR
MVLSSSRRSPMYGLPPTNFSRLFMILFVLMLLMNKPDHSYSSFPCYISPDCLWAGTHPDLLHYIFKSRPKHRLSVTRSKFVEFINTHQSVLLVFILIYETYGIGVLKCRFRILFDIHSKFIHIVILDYPKNSTRRLSLLKQKAIDLDNSKQCYYNVSHSQTRSCYNKENGPMNNDVKSKKYVLMALPIEHLRHLINTGMQICLKPYKLAFGSNDATKKSHKGHSNADDLKSKVLEKSAFLMEYPCCGQGNGFKVAIGFTEYESKKMGILQEIILKTLGIKKCMVPGVMRMEKDQDSSRRTVNVEETSPKAMVAIDVAGFDWSFMAEEEVTTNMALMAFSDSKNGKRVATTASSLEAEQDSVGILDLIRQSE